VTATAATSGTVSVAVFVGTRADLGPLGPVITALADAPDLDLTVLTGVAWTAGSLAAALPAGDRPWRVVALADPVAGVLDEAAVVRHGPALSAGAGSYLLGARPDVLVVLGDRWELLHVVPQAVLTRTRVVHLHGGEVTEGAVDERVRHAVTKLADQHCVASQDAADRVRRLGEPGERVHVTGAPGLDRLVGLSRPTPEALAAAVGREVTRPLALFTYHPPTAVEGADLRTWAAGALRATASVCGTVVATHPGMDAGRDEVLAALAEAADDPRVVVVESLGPAYPVVLAGADLVVGNSSSGVIEAASLGIPVVDVGDRQRGRLRGDNVVHADEGEAAVKAALDLALSPAHRARSASVTNPYGDGHAAARVVDVVRAAPDVPRAKPFVDAPEPR
jgi:UDP-N-acetylglucosamine 2-epimerase (non-hydrolysing)